jgi:hypothetical protein
MAVKDFSAELDEFVAAVSGPIAPGQEVAHIHHAFNEFTDVVGRLVDDLDDQDRAVELPLLKAQAQAKLEEAVQKMPLRPLVRIGILAAIPTVVPIVIDAAADKSSIVHKARDLYLVPAIDFSIHSLLRIRAGVAPDAPPLSLAPEVQNGNPQTVPNPSGPQGPGGAATGPAPQGRTITRP